MLPITINSIGESCRVAPQPFAFLPTLRFHQTPTKATSVSFKLSNLWCWFRTCERKMVISPTVLLILGVSLNAALLIFVINWLLVNYFWVIKTDKSIQVVTIILQSCSKHTFFLFKWYSKVREFFIPLLSISIKAIIYSEMKSFHTFLPSFWWQFSLSLLGRVCWSLKSRLCKMAGTKLVTLNHPHTVLCIFVPSAWSKWN